MRRSAPYALAVLTALLLPWAGLVVAACFLPLPPALSAERARTQVLVLDRNGRLLREVSVGSGAAENPISLDEVSPWLVPALLAAEDSRFYQHPGVDPLALVRAAGQMVLERRVVSGASTLTQQLARTLVPRPRSFLGKLREMALALRLEASLPKRRILEEYLSRVEFGPGMVGVRAASRSYFGKSAAELDLSEAAALVSMPRGPTLYDPRRRPQLLERRRLRVLSRLESLKLVAPAEIARAELTPMRYARPTPVSGAEHLSFALAAQCAREGTLRTRALHTTLDADLQLEAERIAQAALPSLEEHGGDAISLVAMDNDTGEVLAYVGSPSYFDAERRGANDGVVAQRQPGSTLKPFVYATAMAELGYGPATVLPDLPRDYQVAGGTFAPRNYDQRFRGPVLLRQALGSSLNLPAVEVASRVGPPRLLETLRRFGFASLSREAGHYGVGLALGDGEVTLLELVGAYATLARGGEHLPAKLVSSRSSAAGESRFPEATPRRVLRPELAALLTDILSDDAARSAGFGRDSVLNLPFPVAAKTGTSKGYRDNWAVGYTREVTVGVWVGNFDGSPLRDASGITAAGPAFHDLMLGAMRGRQPQPLFDDSRLSEGEVCTVSGALPGPACAHRRRERFVRGREPNTACELHVRVHVDAQGREQDPRCGGATEVREHYSIEYRAWAERAGRPLRGRSKSPVCPPVEESLPSRVTFPREGQRFAMDPDGPARQEIELSAASSAPRLRFVIDDQPRPEQSSPFRLPWLLAPGRHRVAVEVAGVRSEAVDFEVMAP